MKNDLRMFTIDWEDQEHEESPVFSSSGNIEDNRTEKFLQNYMVVFNYSPVNPRTLDDGSDRVLEDPITEEDHEKDRIARSLNGRIGKIVNYEVSPKMREICENIPDPLGDWLVLDIDGHQIMAGFDEVKFTTRKVTDEPRVAEFSFYMYAYEEKKSFLEKAYLSAIPAEIVKYSNTSEYLIEGSYEKYMKALMEAKRYPYQFYKKAKREVPEGYSGNYRIFIQKDGTEEMG